MYLFVDVSKAGDDGASPLHYAARFRANTARPSTSRQLIGDGVDGEVSSVVAPLAQALSGDNLDGGDASNNYGLQV